MLPGQVLGGLHTPPQGPPLSRLALSAELGHARNARGKKRLLEISLSDCFASPGAQHRKGITSHSAGARKREEKPEWARMTHTHLGYMSQDL